MAIKFDTFKTTSGGAGTDNLDDVTSRGATTTNSITVGGVTVGTEYSLPAADGTVSGQVLTTDALGTLSFTTLDFTGGLEYKGAFNATAGTPSLLNAEKGDFYIIDTAGTLYGKTWAVGDHLLINEDMGGTITNSKIDKIDNTQAVTSVNTQTGAVVLSANDLLADHAASNYTPADNNIDGHLSGIDSALGASASPTLDGVTTNGNTTTNAINVGTVTTSGDILADADATRTIGAEGTRFITAHTDINGAIRFKAKNNQGSTINKGQAVYISGISGTVPEVKLAQANSALTMPAFGLALANANDQAEVQIITFGNLTDYNTTTYSLGLGDTVYVSEATAGALTSTAPTGEANLIQNIGRVLRADASAGIIKVGGAGRSNATPNLNQNKIFLGNASNQAVSTALSSVALSSFNDDLSYLSAGDNVSSLTNDAGYLANINSENLGDLSDVTITGAAAGEVLRYSGAAWVDAQLAYADLSGTPTNVSTFTNDAGYLTNINSESLNDLSDVSYSAGAGIDNYVLTYDHSTTSWGAEPASGGGGGYTYSSISGATSAQANYHYSCTATLTLTLPTSGISAGEEIRVKNMSTGTITIDRNGVLIDGVGSDYTLDVQFSSVTLVYTGTNYEVV